MEGMQQWKKEAVQWIQQGIDYARHLPPSQLYVAVSVLLFTTLLLVTLRLLKRTKPNTVLLTGVIGSGKTIMFYQLRDGSSHLGAVTSMEPNEGIFILHSESTKKGKIKPVHLVDVPGHYRLRPKLDEFLPQAAGIVFVVDALEFLTNLHAVSEYLYDILTKASVVKKKIPVLICCNKTDKVTAHSKDFIRKQLEKEMSSGNLEKPVPKDISHRAELLRATINIQYACQEKLRASRNTVSEADVTNDYTLGTPGEVFAFSQCINKITIAEASGLTGELSQVEQFIRECVKP